MRLASLWEIREVIRLDFGIPCTSDSKQRNYNGLRQLYYHFLCVVAPCSLSSKNNKFHVSRSLICVGFWVFKIPPILSLPQEQVKLPRLVRFCGIRWESFHRCGLSQFALFADSSGSWPFDFPSFWSASKRLHLICLHRPVLTHCKALMPHLPK